MLEAEAAGRRAASVVAGTVTAKVAALAVSTSGVASREVVGMGHRREGTEGRREAQVERADSAETAWAAAARVVADRRVADRGTAWWVGMAAAAERHIRSPHSTRGCCTGPWLLARSVGAAQEIPQRHPQQRQGRGLYWQTCCT